MVTVNGPPKTGRRQGERKEEGVRFCMTHPLTSSSHSQQQTTEPNYPEILLIAINKHGVSLIDPKTKVSKTDVPELVPNSSQKLSQSTCYSGALLKPS